MSEEERAAKEALSDIIDYIGVDSKYKQYVQLISYIEEAIKKCKPGY